MTVEKTKALIHRWVDEAWNKGNLAVADEIYDPNYILYRTGSPSIVRGVEGLKRLVADARLAFPDVQGAIDDLIAEGDKVVWRWTFRGTNLGSFMGMAPTRRPVTMNAIEISRFSGGKVVEEWAVSDGLGLMQQLGVIPKPG
jgi:predicted ester cyclase